ncbi:MAG: nitrous oxide reductase accessory protein NosL [Rhodoferax sp.]
MLKPWRAWLLGLALLGLGSAWLVRAQWVFMRAQAGASVEDEFCVFAPPTPYDPASGLGLRAPRPVPVDARCPVCGMFPARAKGWAAQAIFADGATQYFDSPLTLFAYLQDVGRYAPGRRAQEIVASYATDAATGAWVDAQQATYVHGSSALGPMRAGNLPAFAREDEARRFAQARGGELLRAPQINPALVQRLLRPHRHAQRGAPG